MSLCLGHQDWADLEDLGSYGGIEGDEEDTTHSVPKETTPRPGVDRAPHEQVRP